jgi:hypothetical protein
VKFPSDNLSKKELQAMNGEVKTYRLNNPMKWDEFKAMPDDIKITYIKALRQKFNVDGKSIAEMLGVSAYTFSHEIVRLGISTGKNSRGRCTQWDKEGWFAWRNGAPVHESDPVDVVDEDACEKAPENFDDIQSEGNFCCEPVHAPEIPALPVGKQIQKAIPSSGSMTFEGFVESILNTLSVLLGGADVHISITWDVLSEGCEGG